MIGFMRKFTLLVVLLLSVHIGHAQNPVVRDKFEGFECGMMIKGYNDIKEDDIIEGYEMQEVERK